jgi:glycyl-tRNA synthetase beta chain
MPQLLLELFSEEIPARMQGGAARDLERMARDHLAKAGLTFDSIASYAGPRRLTLVAEGLPASTPDRSEELKGPRTTAPEQALEGFLRKTGLTKSQLTERDGVWFAELTTPGRATADIVAEMVPAIMASFPWPKSMRSGSSHFRWVRPLKRILCVFDGRVVPFEVGGVASGDLTEGHRFMGADHGPFQATGFDQYRTQLSAHFVQLDAVERRKLIETGARAACAAEGLELVEDEGLLDEVAGLAEWPVPVLGAMDPAFLDLPAEVIRTSMRTHQKYFAVRDPATGALAPRFVVVANIEPSDGGAVIAAGNAKVLSARLNDARFFWDQDRAPGSFDRWREKLKGVTFHAKLGTLYERAERIEALAREIAPLVGADPELAGIAARYCKADLASGMVGEFPELQGVMGGYYAREALVTPTLTLPRQGGGDNSASSPSPSTGEGRGGGVLGSAQVDAIADAIRDHYKPVGPSDSVPTAPVTVAVALADKLDTLVGFFAIDEKPTGSKDPYALRRAALGVIRILVALERPVSLRSKLMAPLLFAKVHANIARQRFIKTSEAHDVYREPHKAAAELMQLARDATILGEMIVGNRQPSVVELTVVDELLGFFADRLKVLLRDEGKRHDLVDAVFALGDDDLVRITRRVEALSDFLATEDGANLLAGYKRAVNILKKSSLPLERGLRREPSQLLGSDEPKIEGGGAQGNASSGTAGGVADRTPNPVPSPFEGEGGAEFLLAKAVQKARAGVDEALEAEDFTRAMQHLAHLRAPVDAFFDKVMVNDPDPEKRLNRLRLLTEVRDTANRVADFSLISG